MQNLLLLAFGLLQEPVSRAADAVPAGSAGAGPDLTWLMTTSAVLILIIGAVAYGFRRLVAGGLRGRAAKRDLRVLDVLPLGGKRQMAVVRCYDRTFALGLGEKSVEMLAELDTEAIDHDRAAPGKGSGAETADGGNARAAFEARLRAAKERLLGTHELLPQKPPEPAPGTAVKPAPGSTQEFVA